MVAAAVSPFSLKATAPSDSVAEHEPGDKSMTHAKTPDQKPWWRSTKATSLIAVSLATVAFAERDINRRATDEIRGSKLLWRAVSLNALGALAYLKWGRI
jgi:hypothetical protein